MVDIDLPRNKPFSSAAIRMAVVAGKTVIAVPRDFLMFIIHVGFVVLVTIDATEYGIISRIGMAVGTGIPLALVLTRIYRKVLPVVVKGRWYPAILCVTFLTVGRKLC